MCVSPCFEKTSCIIRLCVGDFQAMEAAFAAAAEAGEKHWFQSSKDEMRVKISRSDQICDRMLKMLQNNDEDDQDEEDEDNDSR